MKTSSSIKGAMLSLSALLLAATTQTSQGAIIVHFVEEGADVRVSFSGSIDLSGAPVPVLFSNANVSGANFTINTVTVLGGNVGTISLSVGVASVLPVLTNFGGGPGVGADVFGYSSGSLFWSERHVTGGSTAGGVTELTADPSLDTFVVAGQSYATLFSSLPADGSVLWTSDGTAGDTFVFSSTAPVPEPSSTLLLGFGAFAFLSRRKR